MLPNRYPLQFDLMSGRLELCVFRHGRTVWNALGKYQGHADVDLDDLGRRQAAQVGLRVAAMSPVALYASDLRRCVDTAGAIRIDLPLQTDPFLRERNMGAWSGLTRVEIKERYPQDFQSWIDGSEMRPEGGETSGEMVVRVAGFLDMIVARYKSGTVVAVSHGGWIKTAAQWILTGETQRIGLGVVTQASLTVFSHAHGYWQVEAYNDRGHLLGVEAVDQEPPAPAVY